MIEALIFLAGFLTGHFLTMAMETSERRYRAGLTDRPWWMRNGPFKEE